MSESLMCLKVSTCKIDLLTPKQEQMAITNWLSLFAKSHRCVQLCRFLGRETSQITSPKQWYSCRLQLNTHTCTNSPTLLMWRFHSTKETNSAACTYKDIFPVAQSYTIHVAIKLPSSTVVDLMRFFPEHTSPKCHVFTVSKQSMHLTPYLTNFVTLTTACSLQMSSRSFQELKSRIITVHQIKHVTYVLVCVEVIDVESLR